ncbi:MAG TPA: hypothetical protein VFB16_03585 [Bauldia sp.]|nr:hypothetical protein [Bauldia sp.]
MAEKPKRGPEDRGADGTPAGRLPRVPAYIPLGPLATRGVFFHRLGANVLLALAIVGVSLAIGVLGYAFLGGLPWVDAFLNAAMILSGMGPVDPLGNDAAKIFAGLYAIYSGLTLVATAGLIIAPIIHRFLHRFHIEDESDEA